MEGHPTLDILEARQVAPRDLDVLKRCTKKLEGSALGSALNNLVTAVDEGIDVLVAPNDRELTPSEAAQVLKMSRPHVYKLLDEGVIPHHRVGRDRRIRMGHIVEFIQRREIA